MDFIGIIRVFKGNIALGSLLRRQKKAEAIDSTIQSIPSGPGARDWLAFATTGNAVRLWQISN
jgi:hypothetical protein